MNIAHRTPLTVPEYLAWAEAQREPVRTELIDGHIMQMPAERAVHNRLKFAAAKALQKALADIGIPGEVMIDGMTVPIDATSAYEPDVLLYLGPPIATEEILVPNPVIVVEVLSPSTAAVDRGVKLAGYFTLPSVAHCLIIDPDTRILTHHSRDEGGALKATTVGGGLLLLDPPGLALDLDRVLTI